MNLNRKRKKRERLPKEALVVSFCIFEVSVLLLVFVLILPVPCCASCISCNSSFVRTPHVEPAKFANKKVPRGPPEDPTPILHSPPRKLTVSTPAYFNAMYYVASY